MNLTHRSEYNAVKKRFALALSLLLFSFYPAHVLHAADHVDSPAAVADPAADLTDIYAWMSDSASEVNLILAVPAAAFSDAIQYVFHVESSAAYGEAGTVVQVICEFAVDQSVQCWIGEDDYLTGDASAETGLASETGRTLAFVGQRNDPFFFNSTGFRNTLDIVAAAAPSLSFDGAGCPILDGATSTALITELQTGGDAFALGAVQSLVLQVDKPLLAPGGDVLAVWASTHPKQ